MIKEYIARIIMNGKQDDMEELSEMFDEAIIKVKEKDPECYKKYKIKLMGMAFGYKFDREMVEDIVNKMSPLGEVWDIDTTTNVKRQYSIMADDNDFYIVMNSLINDYGEIIDKNDIETYARMANAFINDPDAIKNKVWEYFVRIAK